MKKQFTRITKLIATAVLTVFLISSCEDEVVKGEYENGAYIVNEGSYGSNNGSISFYSYNADAVENNIFNTVNGREIGDVVQSIGINGDLAYIVVNGSNKVEVVNKNTFEEIETISDVSSPRYIEFSGDKAYLSTWGDNSVKVINLSDNSIETSITVGSGPEKMLVVDNMLYVANKGGNGTDSTISVIDIETNEVVDTISVKYVPTDMVLDSEGYIWTLCSGLIYVIYDEMWMPTAGIPSMLYKIDPSTNEVVTEVTLFQDSHPENLEIANDGTMFIGGGFYFTGIYSLDVSEETVTARQIITDSPYGLNYDPNSDKLFVSFATSFSEAGTLKRYQTNGTEISSYEVGIGPNGASFKNAEK